MFLPTQIDRSCITRDIQRDSADFQRPPEKTRRLSVVNAYGVAVPWGFQCTYHGGGGYPRHFHKKHFPDGTQPMADNTLPTPSSSSTATTGSVSFAEDPRAFYDKETATWRLEDDDGNELEYDQAKAAWIPLVRNLLLSLPLGREIHERRALIPSDLASGGPVEVPTGCILCRRRR
jgi:hypothetical protein